MTLDEIITTLSTLSDEDLAKAHNDIDGLFRRARKPGRILAYAKVLDAVIAERGHRERIADDLAAMSIDALAAELGEFAQ